MTTPVCPGFAGYRFPAEVISHAVSRPRRRVSSGKGHAFEPRSLRYTRPLSCIRIGNQVALRRSVHKRIGCRDIPDINGPIIKDQLVDRDAHALEKTRLATWVISGRIARSYSVECQYARPPFRAAEVDFELTSARFPDLLDDFSSH
jgi:hypothetical protein